MLVEDLNARFHEHVIVGLVASSALQLWDTGAFGNSNPDLGHQHAFEVERDDSLVWFGCNSHSF